MNIAELKKLLLAVTGSTFVTVRTSTEVKLRKAALAIFGNVRKNSVVNGCLNFYYDEAVRRRLVKEGKDPDSFMSGESWHIPILRKGKLTPLCCHKEDKSRIYLRIMLLNEVEKPLYFSDTSGIIDVEDLRPYMYEKKPYVNQGLENPVVFVVYKLENIKEITINKEKYDLEE